MVNLAYFTLSTRHWGEILVARPTFVKEDPWGSLTYLRETPWGNLLPVVSGTDLSHAMHGHADPLMRVIGPPPEVLLRMIPKDYRQCEQYADCIIFVENDCHPCERMPDCYVPPNMKTSLSRSAAAVVAQAWREGRYVVITQGDEFSV